MDMTATSAPAYDVLPGAPVAPRWRLRRGRPADQVLAAQEPTCTPEAEPTAPEPEVVAVATAAPQQAELADAEVGTDAPAEAQADPSPLASFGRWLADLEAPTAKADAAPAASETISPEPLPAAETVSDDERVRSLQHEVHLLAEELDTLRQRSAAERMRLLEELANAREARHAAEKELAAMRAVLDAAEQQIPRQRTGSVSYLAS